jgi:hypothetical protein
MRRFLDTDKGGRVRRLIFIVFVSTLLFAATSASAGGPATTVHVIDMPFFDPGGIDCATGNPADNTGTISGVIHTVATASGGFQVSGSFHGTSTSDDLPADGVPEATNTFVAHFVDVFLASAREVHSFGLHGEGIGTAPGSSSFRFDVVLQLVLDPEGNPQVNVTKIVCR